MPTSYPRGSEWRKWDLHLHTPSSFDYIDKSVTNQEIVDALKETGIAVAAVTDHHRMDVERIWSLRELAGVEVAIFPGIEMRSELGGGPGVHYVGLFACPDTKADLEALWMKLSVALGITLKDVQKTGDERVYFQFEKGATAIRRLEGLVMVHAGHKEGSIEKICNADEFKQQFKADIARSHINILEVGSAAQMEDYRLKVFPSIGFERPIVVGSDNHNAKKYEPRDTCWIKADPTIDGLRQILYEPSDRIHLGPSDPRVYDQSRIIVSVTVDKSNGWFGDGCEMPLNEGQVGVIGGKGTGKTALLDLIALATGSYDDQPESFLQSAGKFLNGCTVSVKWGEGEPQSAVVGGTRPKGANTKYLSQGFVKQKCDPNRKGELGRQIEEVIFQNLPEEDRAGFADFESLMAARLGAIQKTKLRAKARLTEAGETIAAADTLARKLTELGESVLKTERAINRLDGERHAIVETAAGKKETQEVVSKLNKLTEARAAAVRKISGLQNVRTKADDALAEIANFKQESGEFIARLRETLEELEVKRETIVALSLSLLPTDLETIIKERRLAFQGEVELARKEVQTLETEIKEANEKLSSDKALRLKLVDFDKRLTELKNQLHSLNDQKKQAEAARTSVDGLKEKRRELFIEYFELLRSERAELQRIYAPIAGELKKDTGETSLFSFSVPVAVDLARMAHDGNELIDHTQTGPLRHKGDAALRELLETKRPNLILDGEKLSNEDAEAVLGFVDAVESFFHPEENGVTLSILSQLKTKREAVFYEWLYSPDYYSVGYSIRFKGTELENLSPGLKGAALLILYLDLDKKDRRPILIDQPEENLDNRTVYDTLRGYFRSAKARRQIIVVTHNPNLVVNTDAEQVVVANFSKDPAQQDAHICYVGGALENRFVKSEAREPLQKQGIREHVCQVLEGGEEAFRRREQKYGLGA
jgi:hypothetical protein